MSAFESGSVIGRALFDTTQLDAGIARGVEGLGHLGAAGHGVGEEMGHGIMGAEAAMQLFPPIVIELLENPLLGFIALAKEGFAIVIDTVKEVANHFEDINLGSLKSGLDPETFSTFAAAAKASGVEVGTFTNGLELLQNKAAGALRGDAGAAKGFSDLGISIKQLGPLLEDPKQLLIAVADAMERLPNQATRVQAAMESMGKGGKEMLPFLMQGGEAINKLAEQLGDLGARVDPEEAKIGQTWKKLSGEFDAAWEGIKTAVAKPILEAFGGNLDAIESTLRDVAKEISSGITAAMEYLIPIGKTLWGVFQSIADVVGSVLVPAFQVLGAILKPIVDLIKIILDGAAIGLNGFAGLVNSVIHGPDSDQANASFASADAAANRFGNDLGLGNGEQAPAAATTINVNVDPHDSIGQINETIQTETRKANAEFDRQAKAAMSTAKVKHAFGGRR